MHAHMLYGSPFTLQSWPLRAVHNVVRLLDDISSTIQSPLRQSEWSADQLQQFKTATHPAWRQRFLHAKWQTIIITALRFQLNNDLNTTQLNTDFQSDYLLGRRCPPEDAEDPEDLSTWPPPWEGQGQQRQVTLLLQDSKTLTWCITVLDGGASWRTLRGTLPVAPIIITQPERKWDSLPRDHVTFVKGRWSWMLVQVNADNSLHLTASSHHTSLLPWMSSCCTRVPGVESDW